jgi:hypothetical protein
MLLHGGDGAVPGKRHISNTLGRVDWFPDGARLLAGTERGVEIITLGPPEVFVLTGF